MTVTCPECGAKLLAEYTSVDSATCPYCGAQVRDAETVKNLYDTEYTDIPE